MKFDFELTYQQKWENVSSIRHFVSEMLSGKLFGLEVEKKVSTATSELIENIVKYSTGSVAKLAIKCQHSDPTIVLVASNVVSSHLLVKFESIFSEVNKGEAKEAYKEMMLRSLCDTQLSQLGLARIRYECHGIISYDVSESYDVSDFADVSFKPEQISNDSNNKLLSISVKVPIEKYNKIAIGEKVEE